MCGNEEQILRGRFSFLLRNGDDADDKDDYDEELILWAKIFFFTPNYIKNSEIMFVLCDIHISGEN